MKDIAKRSIAYGSTTLVVAGLAFFGFIYAGQVDADPMTLLGSANVQIRLARSFPKTDASGRPNEVRAKLLADARDFVGRARRQVPGSCSGIEMDAYLNAEEGNYAAAAELYRQAQDGTGATAESRDADLLNEARMWRAAKMPKRALQALEGGADKFLKQNSTMSRIETALVLVDLGRASEAVRIAGEIAEKSDESMLLLDAGRLLESQRETDLAETAYRRAAPKAPLANYYLARLKIGAQEFDTGMVLLQRAATSDGKLVRRMLERDRQIWKPVEDDARYKGLTSPAEREARPSR